MKKRQIIWLVLFLLCIGTAIFAFSKIYIGKAEVPVNEWQESYQSILTNEEQEEWQTIERKAREVYLQLNVRIPVAPETKKAEIRLINPPYSAYACKVKLSLPDQEEVLYESEMLNPGTIIEQIEIDKTMPPGEYPARVDYYFYGGKGDEKGSQDVEVTLVWQ